MSQPKFSASASNEIVHRLLPNEHPFLAQLQNDITIEDIWQLVTSMLFRKGFQIAMWGIVADRKGKLPFDFHDAIHT
jgi:hypothetical protein